MGDCNNLISALAVSSVLNSDSKEYGKKFLTDNNDDTCWNSDQGKFQHVAAKFSEEIQLSSFSIQFQGGFTCKQIDVQNENKETIFSCYPEDVNSIQMFPMNVPTRLKSLKLLLLQPTDFFGRIIIYNLKFYQNENNTTS